jgi:hypothetical protein
MVIITFIYFTYQIWSWSPGWQGRHQSIEGWPGAVIYFFRTITVFVLHFFKFLEDLSNSAKHSLLITWIGKLHTKLKTCIGGLLPVIFPSLHCQMWTRLQCMSGKCTWTSIHGISVGGTIITSQADITNTIISPCSSVSSSGNYDLLVLLKTAQKHCL